MSCGGLWDQFCSLLFSRQCLICQKTPHYPLCPQCKERAVLLSPPLCRRCGIPLSAGENPSHSSDSSHSVDSSASSHPADSSDSFHPVDSSDSFHSSHPADLCPRCRKDPPSYILCRSVFSYEGVVREIIRKIKFQNQIELSDSVITPAVHYIEKNSHLFPADFVSPAPPNPAFALKRKCDLSLMTGEKIAETMGVPLLNCFEHTKKIGPQIGLKYAQRAANIADSLTADSYKDKLKGKKILLIDDIITTEATVRECTRALTTSGASLAYVFTIARTLRKWQG